MCQFAHGVVCGHGGHFVLSLHHISVHVVDNIVLRSARILVSKPLLYTMYGCYAYGYRHVI